MILYECVMIPLEIHWSYGSRPTVASFLRLVAVQWTIPQMMSLTFNLLQDGIN